MVAFWITGAVFWLIIVGVFVAGLAKAAGKLTPKVGEGEK